MLSFSERLFSFLLSLLCGPISLHNFFQNVCTCQFLCNNGHPTFSIIFYLFFFFFSSPLPRASPVPLPPASLSLCLAFKSHLFSESVQHLAGKDIKLHQSYLSKKMRVDLIQRVQGLSCNKIFCQKSLVNLVVKKNNKNKWLRAATKQIKKEMPFSSRIKRHCKNFPKRIS